jgi:U3 small nucleolar RNA-associated protein 19
MQVYEAAAAASQTLLADQEYALWLNKRYIEFKSDLVAVLSRHQIDIKRSSKHSHVIKNACMSNLFELLKAETQTQTNDGIASFELLNSIIGSLVRSSDLNEKTLKRLRYFLTFDDIRYFSLKYLFAHFFTAHELDHACFENMINLFSAMPSLVKPKKAAAAASNEDNKDEQVNFKLFALDPHSLTLNSKVYMQSEHRKLFNDCFVKLLRNQFNQKLYKKLLIKLPEKILPKMSNPLMLADFLTQSYNKGGLISVLALNSLFILMNNYNLEYANFFQKVYQLLDSSIFATKYKDRFFQLLDMFLMSTHLSAHLVAAFVKKLSRMSLTCPPADLKFLVLFVYNLLIRHQNCKVLIHNGVKRLLDPRDDPFDINCMDYDKCNALKSSLWEIQSLKTHYSYYVSKEIEKLDNLKPNSNEFQLDEAFENNSYQQVAPSFFLV